MEIGLKRLRQGLARTRQAFQRLLTAGSDEELEELLLAADVGVTASQTILERLRGSGERRQVLEREIARLLAADGSTVPGHGGPANQEVERPLVAMVVGVNGSGKTTTVGKLCHHFTLKGETVVVAAADTYRDAAAEQLRVWATEAGVDIVMSARGQDAAAVAYDAVSKAQSRGADRVLVDTAGRLHTRQDLMAEAEKIKRVCGRVRAGAPDDIWLVLDATVGQNGLRQARVFHEQLGLTGIVVAKLDGTAKGGIVIPIVLELGIPIRFIGTGEGIKDLEPFDARVFARALFEG